MTFDEAVVFLFNTAHEETNNQLRHFLRVGLRARQAYGDDAGIIGLLHDLVEDGWTTEDNLKDAGFPNDIIDAVMVLTRPDGLTYTEYIDRIVRGPFFARAVKRIDIWDNIDRKPKSAAHEARYREALAKLNA